jgi:two-component system sensor histidine kinase YesM
MLRFRRISPVFMKILVIFLIVLMPVYLVGLCVNFIGQRELREKTVQAAIPKLDDCVQRLERDVVFVRNSMMKLHVSPDVRFLSLTTGNEDSYQKMKAFLNLSSRIAEIVDQSEFISDIKLYIPMVAKIITSTGIRDMPRDEFQLFSSLSSNGAYPFSQIDSTLVSEMPNVKRSGSDAYMTLLPFHSMVTVMGEKVPQYLIVLRMDRHALAGMLRELASSTGGTGYLISRNHGLSASTGETPLERRELESLLTKEEQNQSLSLTKQVSLAGVSHLILLRYSEALDTTFLSVVEQATFLSSLQRYRNWLWIATVLTVFMALLFTFLVRAIFILPLQHLVDGFARVETGDLTYKLDTRNHDEFQYLFEKFNGMCEKLALSIEQEYKQRILMQRAELKQLQYQINPHFLYNSLFIVYRMARLQDFAGVMKLALHLGGYYRFVTKGAAEEVTLGDELSHVHDYVQIQTIRFSSRIAVDMMTFPRELERVPVPRLILQPLVENAFHHGLARKVSNGMIRIWGGMEDETFRIVVEDNGDSLADQDVLTLQNHFSTDGGEFSDNGLMNIHRRLRIRYGNESGLFPSRSTLGGLRMEIRMVRNGGTEC